MASASRAKMAEGFRAAAGATTQSSTRDGSSQENQTTANADGDIAATCPLPCIPAHAEQLSTAEEYSCDLFPHMTAIPQEEVFQRMMMEYENYKLKREINQLRATDKIQKLMIAEREATIARLAEENEQLRQQALNVHSGRTVSLHAGLQGDQSSLAGTVAPTAPSSHHCLSPKEETLEHFIFRRWINASTVREVERLWRQGLPGFPSVQEIESNKALRDKRGHKGEAKRQAVTRAMKVVKTVDALADALQLPKDECAKILDDIVGHEFLWLSSFKQANWDMIIEKVQVGLLRQGYKNVVFSQKRKR